MRRFSGRVKGIRFPTFKPFFLFLLVLVIGIVSWNHNVFFARQHPKAIYGYAPGTSHADACDKWQGAEDVVLVMKTGTSEIEAKMPVHLNRTFRCPPNVLVFSDMAQQFKGLMIQDPLQHLGRELNEDDPDLRYYLGLTERRSKGEDIVKGNNTQAWALDRYKNVPMLRQAYNTHPDAKCEPRYMGSSVIGGDNIRFAHGGTGYIISHAAAKLVAEETKEEQRKSFEITKEDCCGDSALAKVLRLHDVLITPAFPNVNGETVNHVRYSKENLCFALVTLHHMNTDELAMLASYQNRMSDGKAIRYADLFRSFVRPKLVDRKAYWDNGSQQLVGQSVFERKITSYKGCRLRCEEDRLCLQFSYEQGHCKISRSVILGSPSNGQIESGWFLHRIDRFIIQEGTCAAQWILG